ncbi:unnamed protein product, partial [Discosporangium mesarthrocarpum]
PAAGAAGTWEAFRSTGMGEGTRAGAGAGPVVGSREGALAPAPALAAVATETPAAARGFVAPNAFSPTPHPPGMAVGAGQAPVTAVMPRRLGQRGRAPQMPTLPPRNIPSAYPLADRKGKRLKEQAEIAEAGS